MRSNSKKKQPDYSKTGGPVYKITIPKFPFEKATQGEKFYQEKLEAAIEGTPPVRSQLSKTGSMLKHGSHGNEAEKK